MKKAFTIIILFLTVSICSITIAEGLLPTLSDVYGVEMPSFCSVVDRFPDQISNTEDGSTEEIFLSVTEEQYTSFGELLGINGCEMVDSNVEGNTFRAVVKKDGRTFKFSYDTSEGTVVINYPEGTYDPVVHEAEAEYTEAETLLAEGRNGYAAIKFAQLSESGYRDSAERSERLWDEAAYRKTIACGLKHIAALKEDGTVVATGENNYGQCNVSDWTNIIAIDASGYNTIGLKDDGTVVVAGIDVYSQNQTAGWKDVVAISTCGSTTFGLKKDGKIVTAGATDKGRFDLSTWEDVVACGAGNPVGYVDFAWGVDGDGKIRTTKRTSETYAKGIDSANWEDISYLVYYNGVLGLKEDGTVVSSGDNKHGKNNVSTWHDIIMIDRSFCHSIGLKKDGTVVAVGDNEYGQCNVEGWINIVEVACNDEVTVALRSDGKVVTTWNKGKEKYDTDSWNGIKMMEKSSEFLSTQEISEKRAEDGYESLSVGSKGENVRRLQQALIDQGFLSDKADGAFGKKTAEAVSNAQKEFGMEVTGIADEALQRRLFGE